MNVYDAIENRRTIFRFKPDPLPADVLERILTAGIWAPNHHLTEPWRFFVLGNEVRGVLAERFATIQLAKLPAGMEPDQLAAKRDLARGKFLDKPVIVAVACQQAGDELRQREDYAATCCAVQNIQLAAWAEGVGAQWGTGVLTRQPETYSLLNLDAEAYMMVGFLYLGYPAEVPQRTRRRPLSEVLQHTP